MTATLLGVLLLAAGLAGSIYASILWAPVMRLYREERIKAGEPPRGGNLWGLDEGEVYIARTGDARRVIIARVIALASTVAFAAGGLIVLLQLHLPR